MVRYFMIKSLFYSIRFIVGDEILVVDKKFVTKLISHLL